MNPVTTYLHQIEREMAGGVATEHTFRPALKSLLETVGPGVTAVNEPRRIRCGAPDFILLRQGTPLGYMEAKDIGVSLDQVLHSDQLRRYLSSLSNLLLTDYLEFRWFVGGEHRQTQRLASVAARNRLKADHDSAVRVTELLQAFLSTDVPTVASPKELAGRMAAIARLIRHTTRETFRSEDSAGSLHHQMTALREVLLHDLTEDQFADMYAQTICYGLFAAWCNSKSGTAFTRRNAAYDLPKTNPFLRQMFAHIAGPDLDDRIVWAVDDLSHLLARADRTAILTDFGRRTRQEDPVVHFYETFLAAYDPTLRESRGVYYTPEPVVSYIVRSVHHLLQTDFGLPEGLAHAGKVPLKSSDGRPVKEVHQVQILDPATGTGTFLHSVVDCIHSLFRGNEGMWSGYVRDHLLPRLYGFELLMAPYAVAHLKMGLQLAASGYDFRTDERLGIYLTNTLEEGLVQPAAASVFAGQMANEANAAKAVKRELPILVIVGNPPYSGHSANKGPWIVELLHGRDTQTGESTGSYFEVDGQPLGEKNPKWLNDDYVKFLRFAQWRIERTGYGVLAFITNHGYLDNPTFRGMRQSLMATFDDLYLLDLHGNSKKKERGPDGEREENVFDIQQGVAIGLFVKRRAGARGAGTVQHAHLWGTRESKYRRLRDSDVASTDWTELHPSTPLYLFVPQDADLKAEYEQGWRLTDVMTISGVGMTTARDHVVIDYQDAPLLDRACLFRDSNDSDADLCRQLGIPQKEGWNIPNARSLIKQVSNLRDCIKPVLYRPFDIRRIFYHDSLVWRTVKQVMGHMLSGRNIGLITTRQTRDNWAAYVTRNIMCHKSLAAYDINTLFPLYLYPTGSVKAHLFDEEDEPSGAPGGRRPNLAPDFLADFAARLGMTFVPDGRGDRTRTFGPEDVFAYLYAVLHAPAYRARYAEFLKMDFPRVPLTGNAGLFRALCGLGDDLTALHLLEKEGPNPPGFPVAGSNVVEGVRYTEPDRQGTPGRVWINRTQHFEGVAPEVWAFQVGGYQVCEKWLKDRKGRALSFDDLQHYRKTVAALAETRRLMTEIDTTFLAHDGLPIR